MVKTLIEKLSNGKTSLELVEESIQKANLYKDKNAVAVISPLAIETAKKMDESLLLGIKKSRLHGIPILIKDNICFNDSTPTTANSYALHDFYPKKNAAIVERLLNAGMVILGKANLSEFAYFMSEDHMPSGYGSMYGQVKHATDETIDPLGSSTGSAVAVKLGITELALGSETNGSLMAPAFQNQIVSFKPTFGLLPSEGIIPISPFQDIAGPMGNSVEDVSILLDILTEKGLHEPYYSDFSKPVKGKVGLISFKGFTYDQYKQETMDRSKKTLLDAGFKVEELTIDLPKISNMKTLVPEFKFALNRFLESVKGETTQTSLASIIAFNEANKERCLVHGQTILIDAEKTSGDLKNKTYIKNREAILKEYSEFDRLLKAKNWLAIGTPIWLGYAPIYGNPSLCIPMGIKDHKPKGIVFVGNKNEDLKLLNLGYQFEKRL